METLGGLHVGAVTQVRQIAAALARSKDVSTVLRVPKIAEFQSGPEVANKSKLF